ncbi:MAG: PAS domain S-box protein [Betaproteobacteria bacterium]|nr:PAS domain S-box protein [Betaproteobacteria bacterium]
MAGGSPSARPRVTGIAEEPREEETANMEPIPGRETSRALLAAVLDQVGEAIISIGEDQRIRMFNKRAEQLFGYSALEAVGRSMDELIPPRFRTAHARHVATYMASGESSRRMGGRAQIAGLRRDGSEFAAEAAISRVARDGCVIATVIIQDISERLKQMEALRASQARLVQAEKMAAIGAMASGIGHEINNPLYAILGMAEAIRDGADLESSRKHGRSIITQTKRIAQIVRNLTEYARPAEKHDLEPVNVNEKLGAAAAMARRSVLSDHVQINLDLGPVPGIRAKSEDIQQALFNVIRNAIQAMESGGVLDIRSHTEADQVVIQIRDTGTGIPAEHLKRIFDPFFTTKGPDAGDGLGLFIVRQIVEKYGGTVAFESAPNEGTLCTIQFPIEETTERRKPNVAQDSGNR